MVLFKSKSKPNSNLKSKPKALKQEDKLKYVEVEEKITIRQLRDYLVLSNGFRIKAIDASVNERLKVIHFRA